MKLIPEKKPSCAIRTYITVLNTMLKATCNVKVNLKLILGHFMQGPEG